MRITNQHVALAAIVAAVLLAFMALSVWLAARGVISAHDLATPVLAVFGIISWAASLITAHQAGLAKLPPAPPGMTWSTVPSMAPPADAAPSDATLSGEIPLRIAGPSVARIPRAESTFVAIDYGDDTAAPDLDTSPQTPDAKKKGPTP